MEITGETQITLRVRYRVRKSAYSWAFVNVYGYVCMCGYVWVGGALCVVCLTLISPKAMGPPTLFASAPSVNPKWSNILPHIFTNYTYIIYMLDRGTAAAGVSII